MMLLFATICHYFPLFAIIYILHFRLSKFQQKFFKKYKNYQTNFQNNTFQSILAFYEKINASNETTNFNSNFPIDIHSRSEINMWDDVWDEQFIDTMILLSIPFLSVLITAIVYGCIYCCKKKDKESHQSDLEAELAHPIHKK